jgi:hypothetical protein
MYICMYVVFEVFELEDSHLRMYICTHTHTYIHTYPIHQTAMGALIAIVEEVETRGFTVFIVGVPTSLVK